MLKKITNLKSEEVFILTSFANINFEKILSGNAIDESNLKYEMLLKDSSLPENANLDIRVDSVIDNLMFDNYNIYCKIKENESRVEKMDLSETPNELKEAFMESKKSMQNYIKLFEKLLVETKFEYPHIRQVQKYFLENRIQEEILLENYEVCSDLKKRIDEI